MHGKISKFFIFRHLHDALFVAFAVVVGPIHCHLVMWFPRLGNVNAARKFSSAMMGLEKASSLAINGKVANILVCMIVANNIGRDQLFSASGD